MVGADDLYDGHDELTGFPKLFYFSNEFDRKKAELGRSGESSLLLCLHLDETTPREKVKAVAEYWKQTFIRVCRCRYGKRDYTFLALDEDTSDPNAKNAKEQEILEALVLMHPDLSNSMEQLDQYPLSLQYLQVFLQEMNHERLKN